MVFKHLEVILVGYEIKQISRKETSSWAPWELPTVSSSPVKVAPPENALAASPWWALHVPCPGRTLRGRKAFL